MLAAAAVKVKLIHHKGWIQRGFPLYRTLHTESLLTLFLQPCRALRDPGSREKGGGRGRGRGGGGGEWETKGEGGWGGGRRNGVAEKEGRGSEVWVWSLRRGKTENAGWRRLDYR